MTDEFDPLAGESGFKDDYAGVVTEAWFAKRDNAGDNLFLHLKINADDGEEVEARYGIGPDWDSFDGGRTVEHPKGSRRGFNNRTKVYGLISAAMALEGCEAVLRERVKTGKKFDDGIPYGPRDSAFWEGMKFWWNVKTETMTFKDRETQEDVTKEVSTVLPTKFMGVEGTSSSASSGSGTAAPSASSTSSANGAIPAPILMQLTAAAKRSATYNDFADAAMQIDGVVDSADIMGKVADEDFYTSLKG